MPDPDNPFHLTPKKPLNIIKRPWPVTEFWSRFFPMSDTGNITFTPPWPFPLYQVNDGETGCALIQAIQKGKNRLLLLLPGVLFLAWFFLGNTPLFLPFFFLGLCFLRHYARTRLLPGLCLPLLKNHPVLSPEQETCSLLGNPETKGADGRFIWTGFFLSASIPALAYWHEANDLAALACGIPTLLALLLSLYSFWPLLEKKELPMKIIVELGMFLIASCWSVLFWYYYLPSDPKAMGQWGYDSQSPCSSLLGYYQDYMSPVSLDRRLQAVDFRPSGTPMEWAAYYISPEEYDNLLTALVKNQQKDMTNKNGSLSKKIQQNNKRQRFPEWWNPALDSQTTSFSYQDIPDKKHLKEKRTHLYKQGPEVNSNSLFPAEERSQTLIYDPKTNLLYLFSRQRHLSPFESLLLYLN